MLTRFTYFLFFQASPLSVKLYIQGLFFFIQNLAFSPRKIISGHQGDNLSDVLFILGKSEKKKKINFLFFERFKNMVTNLGTGGSLQKYNMQICYKYFSSMHLFYCIHGEKKITCSKTLRLYSSA